MSHPVIGMLWGDFPWAVPPKKFGKMLSYGVLARTISQALRLVGTVVPYQPPSADASPDEERAILTSFLCAVDVLWADFYPATLPVLRLRQQLGLACPALLFGGGTLPKGAEALLFPGQHLLRADDQLLFSCQADQQIWRRLVRTSRLREWVVACPVDETIFHPAAEPRKATLRQRYGLPATSPLLLYVGRFNIQKNLHSVLRLLAAVRHEVPQTQLCLVGEEDDTVLGEFGARNTGYVAWLHTLARELGVADAVTFRGPLFGPDLAALYQTADVVVNLSVYHRENFGLSQAEAQACGVPVVCTAWGGFKDVVRPGQTGYLVDAVLSKHGVRVDWATGAQHVITLLQNRDLHAQMSSQAAAWAQVSLTIPVVAQHLHEIMASQRHMSARRSHGAEGSPTYTPSPFARRYERHKAACGWYAETPATREIPARWYPRLFEGRDYGLYETLMEPYATRRAADVQPGDLDRSSIPYFPAGVDLDATRQVIADRDPLWPHQRFLTPEEWAVVQQVTGTDPINALLARLTRQDFHGGDAAVRLILWRLHVDGFLLFSPPTDDPQVAGALVPAHAAAARGTEGSPTISRNE